PVRCWRGRPPLLRPKTSTPTSFRAATCRSCRKREMTHRSSRASCSGREWVRSLTSRHNPDPARMGTVPDADTHNTNPTQGNDSRKFEPAQGYLHSAQNGIGAMAVWPLVGGKGKGVTICDIEGNWNLAHEDLPSNVQLIGGTVINDIGWRNHGTAVLGEMVSKPGDAGTVGIAHQALAKVHSAVIGGVFNTAGAIAGATAALKAGD